MIGWCRSSHFSDIVGSPQKLGKNSTYMTFPIGWALVYCSELHWPVADPTMSLEGDSDMASASLSRRPSSLASADPMLCRGTPKLSGQLPHTSSRVTPRPSNGPVGQHIHIGLMFSCWTVHKMHQCGVCPKTNDNNNKKNHIQHLQLHTWLI